MCSGGKLHSQAEDSRRAVALENPTRVNSLPHPARAGRGEDERAEYERVPWRTDCSHLGKEEDWSVSTSLDLRSSNTFLGSATALSFQNRLLTPFCLQSNLVFLT